MLTIHSICNGNHLIKLCCYEGLWKICKVVGLGSFKVMRFLRSRSPLVFKNCLQLFLIVLHRSQGKHLIRLRQPHRIRLWKFLRLEQKLNRNPSYQAVVWLVGKVLNTQLGLGEILAIPGML